MMIENIQTMHNATQLDNKYISEFRLKGVTVIPKALQQNVVELLKLELEAAIGEDNQIRPDVFDSGMIHNCMVRGPNMLKLLELPIMDHYLTELFSANCIVYAYQSSSLQPNSGNYGSRMHVDTPRFIENYITNVGVIFPLNDFTEKNGATYYLESSHLSENMPTEQEFHDNSQRLLASAGDMIIFNARLVHAAGINHTNEARHALTINFCRSYMRQRFDFPKLIPGEMIETLNATGKRFIGMDVRMPTSLEEFYLPEEQRLYKSGQG